jgi:hypothetical protein
MGPSRVPWAPNALQRSEVDNATPGCTFSPYARREAQNESPCDAARIELVLIVIVGV